MIDGASYRLARTLALRQLPNWHYSFPHRLCFDNSGFPTNIESEQELYQILDSMQETRFDPYMRELGGLSQQEYNTFAGVLCSYVSMHLRHFPHRKLKIPLSTMLSHFAVYRKISRYKENFNSIFEIGPGCGALSFFLKDHAALTNYSFVEASEGYYLLQSMVASHCFGGSFEQRAFPEIDCKLPAPFSTFVTNFFESEHVINLDIPKKAIHYPWWQLGALLNQPQKFDIVVSNANLCEMSKEALDDYLILIAKVLKPEGILFSQCLGGQIYRSYKELFSKMAASGFGLEALIQKETSIAYANRGEYAFYAIVPNAIFVLPGHPHYDEARKNIEVGEACLGTDPRVPNMFKPADDERRIFQAAEFISLISEMLRSGLRDGDCKFSNAALQSRKSF